MDRWMEEETHPKVRRISIVRKSSPWYGMSEEEIEDRREFIRCYLMKDFELVLLVPVKPRENDFWFSSYQEFMESAFNTYDFQRMQRPFDKYGYRIRKVMEQIKDLALLHSCISQPEGRKNVQARFEALVENEFRDQLLSMVGRYRGTFDEERRLELRRKIAKLSGHILECERIWGKYSPWEDSTSHHVQIGSIEDGQTSPPE